MHLTKVSSIVYILNLFSLIIEHEFSTIELSKEVTGAHTHFLESFDIDEHNPAEFVSFFIIQREHVSWSPE